METTQSNKTAKTLQDKIINDTASNEEVMEYLKSEGLDPDKLVREGSTFIKLLNEKIKLDKRYKDLSGALRFNYEEIERLNEWKRQQLEVMKKWDELDEFVRNHPESEIGQTVSSLALDYLKDRDRLKSENDRAMELLREISIYEVNKNIDAKIDNFLKGEKVDQVESKEIVDYYPGIRKCLQTSLCGSSRSDGRCSNCGGYFS